MSGSAAKKLLRPALALAVAGILLFWCLRQIQWPLLLQTLEHARAPYLALAFFCPAFIVALNSLQWKLFLPRFGQVPFRRMAEWIAIFSMTVNVVPFWGGHALMVYLLGVREKVGKTQAFSAVTLDQIVEGPAKLLLFALASFFFPLPPWMKEGMRGFFFLFMAAYLVLMTVAFLHRNHSEEADGALPGVWGKVRGFIGRWAHHLHVLRSWKPLVITVCLAVLMKGIEIAAVYFIQKGLNTPFGLAEALLATVAVSLATTLPLTPGRLGVFEAAAMVVYQFLGATPSVALALGIFIHAAHTLPFIVLGYAAMLRTGFKSKEAAFPKHAPENSGHYSVPSSSEILPPVS